MGHPDGSGPGIDLPAQLRSCTSARLGSPPQADPRPRQPHLQQQTHPSTAHAHPTPPHPTPPTWNHSSAGRASKQSFMIFFCTGPGM